MKPPMIAFTVLLFSLAAGIGHYAGTWRQERAARARTRHEPAIAATAPEAPPATTIDAGAAVPAVAAPAPASAKPAAPELTVRAVHGQVDALGANGVSRALRAGDKVAIDDVLRTGASASATVSMGAASIEIHPRSRLAVKEVERDVSRVLLSAGRISADVPADRRQRVRVEVAGSKTAASSSGGRFSVITDGAGLLAVASTEGTVKLGTPTRSVDVQAGQQSVARPGQAPEAPRRIPTTLFLKVGRPPARVQREPTTVLRGTTQPGSVVIVNDTVVASDEAGRFSIVVPLREGPNTISVEAEDATGRRSRRSAGSVNVRSSAPPVSTRVRW